MPSQRICTSAFELAMLARSASVSTDLQQLVDALLPAVTDLVGGIQACLIHIPEDLEDGPSLLRPGEHALAADDPCLGLIKGPVLDYVRRHLQRLSGDDLPELHHLPGLELEEHRVLSLVLRPMDGQRWLFCLLRPEEQTDWTVDELDQFIFSGHLLLLALTPALPLDDDQAEADNHGARFRDILDNLDAAVHVVDMDSHEVLFTNRYVREKLSDMEGAPCWEMLEAERLRPAELCGNSPLLDDEGAPTGVHSWELHDPGSRLWYDVRDCAIPWEGGRMARLEIATDITERKKTEQAFRFLAEHGQETGEDFIQRALQQLAELYEARWVYLALFDDGEEDHLQTQGLYDHGSRVPDLRFPVKHSPVEQALLWGELLLPHGVRQQYAQDQWLHALQAESFYAVNLQEGQETNGVLAVMHDREITANEWTRPVMRSFANRILAELQRAAVQEALNTREEVLHAISISAKHIVSGDRVSDAIRDTVQNLWEATGVSRVYVVENRQDLGDRLCMVQRTDWLAGGIEGFLNGVDECCTPYEEISSDWVERLGGGQLVFGNTADCPVEEQAFLKQRSVVSFALVPISVDNEWWGFIGFDECRSLRPWLASERDALSSAADIIGAAIARERHQSELALAASVYANTQEAIMITDRDCHIIRVNDAFTQITGYGESEALGKTPDFLFAAQPDEDLSAIVDEVGNQGSWRGEIHQRRSSGEVFPTLLNVTSVTSDEDQWRHCIAQFTDITERKESEAQIQHLANFDILTDLPNRRLFRDRLEQGVRSARRRNQWLALFYVDLDRFKQVNDTQGHQTGDSLLQEVAQRLNSAIRDSDTVARIGGDEFAVILPGFEAGDGAINRMSEIAKNLIARLSEPYLVGQHRLEISASIGIAIYPRDTDEVDQMLVHADTAMYHAKYAGRHNFQFFSEEMNARAHERLELEIQLREAIAAWRFDLYYQPRIQLTSGRLMGVEALVRWRRDNGEVPPPGEFIPVAEDTGLIDILGDWIVQRACRQLGEWRRKGYERLRMGINISAHQLRNPGFVEHLREALDANDLPAGKLELEITENSYSDHLKTGLHNLEALKEMGVRLILDDFGTGYTSLTGLQSHPIDAVKIDRSFIQGVPHAKDASAITAAIIAMGRSMDLKVVAEGVETHEQLSFLRRHDCDEAQGFLITRPQPAARLNSLLKRKMH